MSQSITILGTIGFGVVAAAAGIVSEMGDTADNAERIYGLGYGGFLVLVILALVAAIIYKDKRVEDGTKRREAASANFHTERDKQMSVMSELIRETSSHIATSNAVNANLVVAVDKLNTKLDASIVELARRKV